MNLLKFHGVVYENIHEKILKFVLIPCDISCKFHRYLSSSVYGDSGKLRHIVFVTLTIQQPYMAIQENFVALFS